MAVLVSACDTSPVVKLDDNELRTEIYDAVYNAIENFGFPYYFDRKEELADDIVEEILPVYKERIIMEAEGALGLYNEYESDY